MSLLGQTFLATSKTIAAGTLSVAMMAPLVGIESATAASFSDVSFSYWARPFIETLAQYDIVNGYDDGSFRPEEVMTRSEFMQLLDRSFGSTGSSVPGSSWEDDQPITRMQALVMLSNRLGLEPKGSVNSTLSTYKDAVEIPSYAREGVAAATENRMVVNYPNVRLLMPYQAVTRAGASAFIHQALVYQGQLEPINSVIKTSSYIVDQPLATPSSPVSKATKSVTARASSTGIGIIPAGTEVPLEYPNGRNVNLVIAPGETYATTLSVSSAVLDSTGEILIPEGSRVRGRFVPMKINGTEPATQFVADRLILGNQSYPIQATSNPRIAVSESEVEPVDLETSITSAAAKSIVRSIEGQPTSLGNILSETFGLNQAKQDEESVIVIDPDSLVLTTQSRLRIASR